jgi:hypothetical protein
MAEKDIRGLKLGMKMAFGKHVNVQ